MQEKLDVNFTNKFNQDLQKELEKLEVRKKQFAESLRMSSGKKDKKFSGKKNNLKREDLFSQRYTTNPLMNPKEE